MAKEAEKMKWHRMHKGGGGNAVYGLGFVGALIYFLQHATTLGDGLFGIIKAILWPGFIVYRILEFFRI